MTRKKWGSLAANSSRVVVSASSASVSVSTAGEYRSARGLGHVCDDELERLGQEAVGVLAGDGDGLAEGDAHAGAALDDLGVLGQDVAAAVDGDGHDVGAGVARQDEAALLEFAQFAVEGASALGREPDVDAARQ